MSRAPPVPYCRWDYQHQIFRSKAWTWIFHLNSLLIEFYVVETVNLKFSQKLFLKSIFSIFILIYIVLVAADGQCPESHPYADIRIGKCCKDLVCRFPDYISCPSNPDPCVDHQVTGKISKNFLRQSFWDEWKIPSSHFRERSMLFKTTAF